MIRVPSIVNKKCMTTTASKEITKAIKWKRDFIGVTDYRDYMPMLHFGWF